MGIHAGVCFFDGRPMDDLTRGIRAHLQCVTSSGIGTVAEAGVVMGWEMAASSCARQPQRSASGLVMTWDGRLDNRDDLRRQLVSPLDDESDAAIALTIFERRGIAGLRSLVGDWSLVVWAPALRTLYLARDYMGVRPLYYCRDGSSVSWSSSLGELTTRSGRTDQLDETFVAGFMALRLSTDVTPYRGIRAVPCAHAVRLGERGETRHRFWHVEPATIRYGDRRNYEDHLRAIWKDAVGARLRTAGTVWAELSGGLDSSSIVCVADALVKERRVAAAAIQPVSHVTFDSPEGDERTFIKEVESWTGVASAVLSVEQHQDLRASDDWVTPLAARGIQVASERHVGACGGRVILSGRLGDLVMGCTSDNSIAVLDDFAEWRVGRGLSKLLQWSRSCHKPFIEVGSTLVAQALRAASGRPPGGAAMPARSDGTDLLAARLRPLARAWAAEEAIPRVRWSARRLAAAVLGCSREARLEDRSSDPRVTYSYPFAHRPLVEYMLGIPAEELSEPGTTRSLMRRALAGLVPDRILRRQSKGCYPPAVMRAVRRTLASSPAADRLEIVRRGWLDATRLAEAMRNIAHGAGQTGGEVQRALVLEEWLARRHRRGPAAFHHREEVTDHGVHIA